MIDVVVNNVMATSVTPDLSTYYFKQGVCLIPSFFPSFPHTLFQFQYHNYCAIQWGNTASEQNCWLGDTKVPLPDLNTQDPTVVSGYANWIKSLVSEYGIDGLRIDGKSSFSLTTDYSF
jgi:alpha-amylase